MLGFKKLKNKEINSKAEYHKGFIKNIYVGFSPCLL